MLGHGSQVADEARVVWTQSRRSAVINTWLWAFLAYDLISCQFVSPSIAAWREPQRPGLSRTFSFRRSQDTPTRILKEDSEIAKGVESDSSIA
jgi:hypothetical protein